MRKRSVATLFMAVLVGVAAFAVPRALSAQDRATQAAQAMEAQAKAAEAQARAEAIRREVEALRRETLAATDIVQKVIQVRHADVQRLAGMFHDWVVSLRPSPELKLLTVAGKAEAVARLEEAIKELDVPEKWAGGGHEEAAKSFTLQHVSTPQELQEIATTIRGLGDVRRVFVVNSTNTIVIRGTAEQIELAQQVIDATDKPRPDISSGNVEFVVHLIEGTDQASPGVPKALEGVVQQLKSTFPYDGYRLMETFVVRTKVGGSSTTVRGLIPNTASDALPAVTYDYSVRVRAIVPQGSTKAIQLESLHLSLNVPVPMGGAGQYNHHQVVIETEMSVPEGKTVTVGKAGAAGSIRGLFLVMTANVVE